MKSGTLASAVILLVPAVLSGQAHRPLKQTAAATVERQRAELIRLSDEIWGYAEIGLQETRSAEVLAAYAQRAGFTVDRGVAGMPTAFVASYGSGKPVIAILGEYDALPGISRRPCLRDSSLRAKRATVVVTTSLVPPASAPPSPSRR
jgi:aminobenzoyl-glutamate utilization protein B